MISRNVRADRMWLCQGDSSCDVNATRDVKGALQLASDARKYGYSDRAIIMYSQLCPKGDKWPKGFTVDAACSMMAAVKAQFPEMPGVAFCEPSASYSPRPPHDHPHYHTPPHPHHNFSAAELGAGRCRRLRRRERDGPHGPSPRGVQVRAEALP